MLMVVACHANGYVNQEDLVGLHGITKLLINQFCLVCVDVCVMISGWFGIKASWKGAAKLLFQVLYVTASCVIIAFITGIPVSFKNDVLPYLLFGKGYWFVVSYLILYALAPILNSFVENASQKVFRSVLLSWLIVEFIFGFVLDFSHFSGGFSPLFFIGLYLLARYAHLFPESLFKFNKKTDFTVYFILSILSAILFWFGYKWLGMGFHLNRYDSPLAILASLYFLLGFSKCKIHNNAINWLASSAFAIYLIHTHNLVYPYFKRTVAIITGATGFFSIGVVFAFVLFLSLVCIIIDKPRLLLWERINKRFYSK